jgi:8-hydroxy-5-deazaflavin:NADPH oxidoreductase
MKIAILGGGSVGGALGQAWAKKGHDVFFGVRKPDAPDMRETLARCEQRAKAGSSNEAAAFGDVIVNALPWPATRDVLSSLDLSGKALLDATNPLKPDLSGLEIGTTSSGGELVAQWAKGARVVNIFNSTGYANMADPLYDGAPTPMFYCGDDAEAKTVAARLAADCGFTPVDCGPLSNSRLLEPLANLWVWLAYPGGLGRNFAFQIVKR